MTAASGSMKWPITCGRLTVWTCSASSPKKQGHATEIAQKLCQTGEPLRFYACGGDGTVNEVANGIIGYDNAAMSVIPVGTGNDFLKNFGGDMDKFRDAENLWDGPQFPMDAIDVNGRVALTIACSGIDAGWPGTYINTAKAPFWTAKAAISPLCW